MKKFFLIIILALVFFTNVANSQIRDWSKLIPLESDRSEVERILGKPKKYFETYGSYETEIGRFHVWFSSGGCKSELEGLQWDVKSGKLTGIVYYPNKSLPLEFYISNLKEFKKQESPSKQSKYLYISSDEAFTYQTILTADSKEFVYTIELEPSKDKKKFLCKKPC